MRVRLPVKGDPYDVGGSTDQREHINRIAAL